MAEDSIINIAEILSAGPVAVAEVVTVRSTVTVAESYNDEGGASCLIANDLRGTTSHPEKDGQTNLPSIATELTKGL